MSEEHLKRLQAAMRQSKNLKRGNTVCKGMKGLLEDWPGRSSRPKATPRSKMQP